jgi:serine/threonine-protein kinase
VRRADGAYEQQAALKLLSATADQGAARARFLQERQILARLEHPAIARLLDGGVAPDGRPWLALERVDGLTLTAWADARRLAIGERVRLFLAVLGAVAFAHRNLVVHRDLKPSNILVTPAGEVKLLDFGIAKLLDRTDEGERTLFGGPLTPQYAAPEQVTGGAITTATDVYALGLVLYELLSGGRPYRVAGDSALAMERAILATDPRPPSAAVAGNEAVAAARASSPERLAHRLTGDLDAIVGKALEKQPAARYPSAEALARDLESHLAGRPIAARPATRAGRALKFARRHRVGVAATMALATALLAGLFALGYALLQSRARLAEARRAEAIQGFLLELFSEIDPERARGREVPLREVVDRGAARLASELRDQPRARAELLLTLGTVYRRLAHYREAERLLDEALALARREYGERSPEAGRALVALGDLDYWRDDYPRALDRHREALAIFTAAGTPSRSEAAATRFNVGTTLRQLGRFEEALDEERHALEIERELHGEASLEVAEIAAGLALTLHGLNRDEEAIPFAEAALVTRRKLLPADHPRIADALEALGLARMGIAETTASVAALEESLAIRRRVHGPDHPAVLETMNSLASALEAGGRFDEALVVREAAMPLARRILPAGSDSRGVQANNYAFLNFRLRRFAAAAAGFAEAAAIWRVTAGERSTRVATVRNNLGFALLELGRPAEAEREVAAALAIREELLGAESAEVAQSLRILALARLALGERAAARADLDRSVALSRRVYAERHPRLAEALASRARLAAEEGRPADARRDLEEALAIREARLGVDNPLTVALREELARLGPD